MYEKKRRETDVNFSLNKNTRYRIYHPLKGRSKSSSTKETLGIDIDTYRKWVEYPFTLGRNWCNIEIDHVKPVCMFDLSNNNELKEASNWKNIQSVLNETLEEE